MAQIKKGPVLLLSLLVVGALLFGARYAINNNLIPGLGTVASSVPEQEAKLKDYSSDAPNAVKTSFGNANVSLPSNEETDKDLPVVRITWWAWNAHANTILANGGPVTTKGSLMEKYGVKLILERNDNTSQLRDLLFVCASELESGARDCSKGIHFTTLMGDQLGAQFGEWNPQFRKLGEDLTLEVVGFNGRSDGEDAYLAPPQVKADPQAARGTVVVCAPREGDQNIVFFVAARNGTPINVDNRTYDPDAINFWDAESYTQAAELYNSNPVQKRAEVRNGKRTGKTVEVRIDSIATWSPADVTVTVGENARGGLVRIWSTKENSSQMPNALLGIKRWNKNNFQIVVRMLAAFTEAGEQLRSSNAALRKAAELSAKVYNEADGNFWYQYYLGKEEFDTQGNKVQLGGSLAFTLADNLRYWGINGGTDYFRDSYELFGGYMHQYYPDIVTTLEPYDQIANKSFIKAVANMRKEAATQVATGVVREFTEGERITEVGARQNWKIEFETGKDIFTPSAVRTLEELRRVLGVAQNTLVEVHGHTDSAGDAESNQGLSERRAFAVKRWLQGQSSESFPDNRLRVFAHGETQPVADNTTADGKARNRRVEIVLGK